PNITGFIVAENPGSEEVDIDVTLYTHTNRFIPENASVIVGLDDQKAEMHVKEFIARAGSPFNYIKSENREINFHGYGFIGDYNYTLNIGYFDINTILAPGTYPLTVEVLYNYYILSEYSTNITIEQP
ncbi:hypothetical protein HQ529_00715, partial [Candidatus Woesearchaeota archaeon]|nr:hypothetical protein [Candidatus Woesearchaeota archaeon]